jgi:sigma-B regulation protein RsbU (phosphoserine phosphatase)
MKQKRRQSVSHRVNGLLLFLVLAIAGGLIAIAYWANTSQVDEFYRVETVETAATVSSLLNGDRIGALRDFLSTPEYQEIRNRAEEAEDEQMIEDCLAENGWLEEVQSLRKTMSGLRDLQDAKYIYMLHMPADRHESMYVLDPDEPLWIMGLVEADAEGFERKTDNERIEPTVSLTDFGWLSSGYEPVLNSAGEAVACVGVDIDMTKVMRDRNAFLIRLLTYAIILGLTASVLVMYLMSRTVTKPISMLSKAVGEFGSHGGKITSGDVINLPIHTRDEIGLLYQETREMEIRLIDYMDNLATVTAEKERIGAELSIATHIQADMLPRIFPAFPGRKEVDIYATMTPAKEVGGDFYDFFLIDENHVGLVMADVSGKGVPAALFMVIAKTLIKNRALMGGGPAEILSYVNEQLCEGNEAELFVTVWFAILDLTTGKGLAANAGHEHPAIRRAGGEYVLEVYRHSPAVATMKGMRFREHEFELHPGDSLFVYTDGVTEATNANNELFGNDRMLDALNEDPEATPEKLLPTVRRYIDNFVGDAPQFDDITMMCLLYKGQEGKSESERGEALDQ